MPLKITAATKGTGTCQHYTLRVQDSRDGYDETITFHMDQLLDLLAHIPAAKRRAAVAAIWAYYRIRISGATPASCVNVEIA